MGLDYAGEGGLPPQQEDVPYVPDEWLPLLERGRIDVGERPGRPRVRLAGTGPGNIEWLEAVSSNCIKREEIGERHNRIGYDMMVACLGQGGPLQGRPDSVGRKTDEYLELARDPLRQRGLAEEVERWADWVLAVQSNRKKPLSAHRRARPTGSASDGPRWSISSGAAAPSQTGQQPMGRNSATGGHQIMGEYGKCSPWALLGTASTSLAVEDDWTHLPAGPSGDGINTGMGSLFAVACGRSSAGKTTDAWTLRFARF